MRSATGNARETWKLPVFVLFGTLFSLALALAVHRFPADGGIGGMIILGLAVPALFIFVVGLWQAALHWAELRKELRWWHWIWFLMYFSALVFQGRGSQESAEDPLNAAAMLRIGPELLIGVVLLVCLARKRPRWLDVYVTGVVGALTTYGAVCFISTVWSVYWPWTMYKGAEYLLDVAVIAVIISAIRSTEEYESLFNWTWTLFGVELLWVWSGIIRVPDDALRAQVGTSGIRLSGVMPIMGSDSVGGSGVILAIIGLTRLLGVKGRKSEKSWNLLLLAFGLATMLISETRSAIGGFVLAVLVILIYSGRAKFGAIVAIAGAALLTLTGVGSIVWNFLLREQSTEQVESLTGRLFWWSYGLHLLGQHPFTGLGAFAAARFAVFSALGLEGVPQLHSDWIETFVGTSIWGVLPLLIALIWTWRIILRSVRDPGLSILERQLALEALGVLTVITTRSFVNVELCWHAPVLFLVVLGYAELLRRKKQQMRMVFAPRAMYAVSAR